MKKLARVAIGAIVIEAAIGLGALGLASSASAAERSFPASGFDKVWASGSEDVTIITGKAASVVATGPQDRLDLLRIGVDGTTLKIDHKPNSGWSWRPEGAVRITVTMPALHGVHGSGSGNITADSGSGAAFEASTSGSGDMKIARIDSAQVALRTSGSGDITAAGRCTDARVTISGSGDMALGGLACRNLDVQVSGSGDVAANATGDANIRISGSGDVGVKGGARCTSRTSGSGDVNCG